MRAQRGVQVVVGVKEAANVSLAPQLALPKVPRVAAFQLKSCIAARHDVEREQAAIVAARCCNNAMGDTDSYRQQVASNVLQAASKFFMRVKGSPGDV